MTFIFQLLVLASATFFSAPQDRDYREVTGSQLHGFAPSRGFPQLSLVGVGEGSQLAFTGVAGKDTAVYLSEFTAEEKWSEPARISPEGSPAFLPALHRASDGTRHLAWIAIHGGARRVRKPSYEVFYSRRKVGDSEWSAPRSFGTIAEAHPVQLSSDAEKVFLFSPFPMAVAGESPSVLYVSRDGGDAWSACSGVVSGDSDRHEALEGQVLTGPAGELLVAWLNPADARRTVFFNVSRDGGKTWLTEPTAINPGSTKVAGQPVLFTSAGSLFLMWKYEYLSPVGDQSELWVDRSIDWGSTWEGGRQIYQERASGISFVPFTGEGFVGCLWSERPPVGEEALKYLPVWKDNGYVESREATLLHRAGRGAHFGEVSRAGSDSGSSLAFVCENGTVPGKLWLALPEDGARIQLVQVGRETAHHDVRKPLGTVSRDPLRLMLVFHEATQMRFFGEPEKRESSIFSVLIDPKLF